MVEIAAKISLVFDHPRVFVPTFYTTYYAPLTYLRIITDSGKNI